MLIAIPRVRTKKATENTQKRKRGESENSAIQKSVKHKTRKGG